MTDREVNHRESDPGHWFDDSEPEPRLPFVSPKSQAQRIVGHEPDLVLHQTAGRKWPA